MGSGAPINQRKTGFSSILGVSASVYFFSPPNLAPIGSLLFSFLINRKNE
jgi:hypothetical protein